MVSTGISLGSNYSIAFGTSHPDWFSAIVPVSTEGDSRELLLRNLKTMPVYILEGSQDKNIREISGPRALRDIVSAFGYDLTYREFGDRAHEGLPGALRRCAAMARDAAAAGLPARGAPRAEHRDHADEPPRPLGRGRYAPGVRAGRDHRTVAHRHHRPVGAQAHASTCTIGSSNLDQPVEIRVNGVPAFSGKVARSALTALSGARARGDERAIFAAEISVDVPATPAALAVGERAFDELTPKRPEGTLSFWEMYATRALEERVPSLGLDGAEEALPAGVTAARRTGRGARSARSRRPARWRRPD